MRINSLADLKRLPVGTRLKMVEFYGHPVDFKRIIVEVNSNSLALAGTGTINDKDKQVVNSYLSFPKAKNFLATEDGFAILENGKVALRYVILD